MSEVRINEHMVLTRNSGVGTASLIDRSQAADERRSSRPQSSSWPTEVIVARWLLEDFRADDWSGRERLGFLVGYGRPGAELEVFSRFRSELDDNGTRRSAEFDLAYAAHRRSRLQADEELVGIWHQHPPETSANMSPRDIETAASLARRLGREHFVSVIAMQRENAQGELIGAQLAAYVVTPDGDWRHLAIVEGGY